MRSKRDSKLREAIGSSDAVVEKRLENWSICDGKKRILISQSQPFTMVTMERGED